MNNGKTIDFSNAIFFFDGEEIGTAKSVTTEVMYDETTSNKLNTFNFSKGYSGTLKVTHIDTENPLFKTLRLEAAISYYTDVVYYARHSKKKHVAIQKLNKLIDEYNQLKGNI